MARSYSIEEADIISRASGILGNDRFRGEEIELILEAAEIEYLHAYPNPRKVFNPYSQAEIDVIKATPGLQRDAHGSLTPRIYSKSDMLKMRRAKIIELNHRPFPAGDVSSVIDDVIAEHPPEYTFSHLADTAYETVKHNIGKIAIAGLLTALAISGGCNVKNYVQDNYSAPTVQIEVQK